MGTTAPELHTHLIQFHWSFYLSPLLGFFSFCFRMEALDAWQFSWSNSRIQTVKLEWCKIVTKSPIIKTNEWIAYYAVNIVSQTQNTTYISVEVTFSSDLNGFRNVPNISFTSYAIRNIFLKQENCINISYRNVFIWRMNRNFTLFNY